MTRSRLLSPIALFVYNRPEHTKKTVDALLNNREAIDSDIFIFSDAAREASENEKVSLVRAYIASVKGFKTVSVIEREANIGLANSIIDGVTKLCDEYGRAIVLEDDLEVSPYFLKYMNDGLDLYESNEEISSISGYMYPISLPIIEDTFFTQSPQSWGWATWKKAWDLFDSDGEALLSRVYNADLTKSFDKHGPYSFVKMLKGQIEGKNNSWLIRWYASCFLERKLTLMPARSLVKNIGIDGAGEHCANWKYDPFMGEVANEPITVNPIPITENVEIVGAFEKFYKKIRRLRWINFFYRCISKVKVW